MTREATERQIRVKLLVDECERLEAERDRLAEEMTENCVSKTDATKVANEWQKRAADAVAEAERYRAALSEAAIPLEVIAGSNRMKRIRELSPLVLAQIDTSLDAIREALSGGEEGEL